MLLDITIQMIYELVLGLNLSFHLVLALFFLLFTNSMGFYYD